MGTYLFVNLKIVRHPNVKYDWEMESQPESFKGFTTIMSGCHIQSKYLEVMTDRNERNPSETRGTYLWMNLLEHL